MRRIAVLLLGLALAAGYFACSTDAPAPTPPNQGGGGSKSGGSPLLITLFTGDANPGAGGCTLVQAIVTLNGQAVADGTGVAFSTDFGTFAQNSLPLISVVTQKGSAVTALCSSSTGTAFVTARATVNGISAKSDQLKIVFQPTGLQVPFFSSCSNDSNGTSVGPNTGGYHLIINGGNFLGDETTTRVMFTAMGITREAPVVTVQTDTHPQPAQGAGPNRPNFISVLVPAFPEAQAPFVPVSITVTFLANSSPITVALPNCFAYGTLTSVVPSITALLPSSGSNEGGTRVSIIGTGFSAPVQVFFGASTEAQVVSVTFSQIVVITPQANANNGNLNNQVAVRVHEVNSGMDATPIGTSNLFQYVQKVQITAFSNNTQPVTGPFTTVTISGLGFQAPIAVSLAGVAAYVTSVSATEIQVIPGAPLFDPSKNCNSNIQGPICVTDIDTGNSNCTQGDAFFYVTVGTPPCFTPTPTITPIPTKTPTPAPTVTPTPTP